MYDEKKQKKIIINIIIKSQQTPNSGVCNKMLVDTSYYPACSYRRVYYEGYSGKLPNYSVALIHEKLTSTLEVFLILNILGPF